jgi:hypothetical protein
LFITQLNIIFVCVCVNVFNIHSKVDNKSKVVGVNFGCSLQSLTFFSPHSALLKILSHRNYNNLLNNSKITFMGTFTIRLSHTQIFGIEN